MKSKKMYIIVFGIIIIKLQISVSEPQFPPHVDLQKVGETIFNNEKFNILRPTTHRVTDHFKEFMLRTKSSDHPAKRVFIDNNGFRHDWSGFGEKTRSLRKTDLKHVSASFENALEDTPEPVINSKVDNDNATATVEDDNVSSTENENNNQEVENNVLDNNDTVKNLNEEDSDTPESKKTTTILNLFPSSKISIEKRLRESKDSAEAKLAKKADPAKKEDKKKTATKKNTATTKANDRKKKDGKKDSNKDGKKDDKKKDKKKDKRPDSGDKAKKDDKKKDRKGDKKSPKAKKKRTVVTTTFFCPYFGTITMSSFID